MVRESSLRDGYARQPTPAEKDWIDIFPDPVQTRGYGRFLKSIQATDFFCHLISGSVVSAVESLIC
ncbi:protein of unknown function [Pararobbsia alpina]